MILPATDSQAPLIAIMGPVVIVLGVLTFAVLITVGVRGRVVRRQATTPAPREMIQRIKDRAASQAATTAATSEMLDSAQRLAAQLDNKAKRLERLIAEADDRLRRLQQVEASAPAAAAPRERAPLEPEPDPLTRSIYDLADAGHEPVDIARRLDEHIGKVELILALRTH